MKPVIVLCLRRFLLQLLSFCCVWLGPAILLLTAPTSSAQTPAPAAGGAPRATQLQRAHDLGQEMAANHFDTEVFPHGGPPPKDLLRPRFDEFMKGEGTRFSDAEKEVFTEAYWSKYEKRVDRFQGGMTQIDPPNLLGPDTSTTTTISGKTATPGPDTLQLTDAKGNSHFVDVDPNGNYEVTVPQRGFQPIKMTFRSATLKAAWRFTQNGIWEQMSTATGTGAQDGMPSGGTAAYALFDECNRAVLMASLVPETRTVSKRPGDLPPRNQSSIHLIRLFSGSRPIPDHPRPPVRRVNDPLPPEAVREAQRQGIDHADQQFEKMQLEKIPKASRTPAQNERLDKLNDMLKDYDNAKNSPFANKEAIDISEKATQARWLQRQAQALRASGAPGSAQSAQNIENQAKQLLGGQDLPPLRASAQEPLQFSSVQRQGGTVGQGTRLVAAGQSGFAVLRAPGSITTKGSGPIIKGHTTLVATGEIKTSADTQIQLEPLAHLEEEPSATASFPQYLGFDLTNLSWGKPNLNLAPEWSASDEKPSYITTIGTNGEFEFKDWGVSAQTCYKLNVSYGYDRASTAISPQTALTYEVTFNANPSWIAAFKPGIDINRFQSDYMTAGQVGGTQYTWTHWHTPFPDVPMVSSGQISDEGYNHLSWELPYKNVMVYGEHSPGTTPLPVPGLTPADWPKGAADPLPVLVLTGTRIKE